MRRSALANSPTLRIVTIAARSGAPRHTAARLSIALILESHGLNPTFLPQLSPCSPNGRGFARLELPAQCGTADRDEDS